MTPPAPSCAASRTMPSTDSRGTVTATQSGTRGSEAMVGKQRRSPSCSYFELTRKISPSKPARLPSTRSPNDPALGEAPTMAMLLGLRTRSSSACPYTDRTPVKSSLTFALELPWRDTRVILIHNIKDPIVMNGQPQLWKHHPEEYDRAQPGVNHALSVGTAVPGRIGPR